MPSPPAHDNTTPMGAIDAPPPTHSAWKQWEALVVFFICLFCFLALSLSRINDLMGQDEASHYYKLIRLLYEKGWQEPGELITFSPHGYPLFALLACKCLGGVSQITVRLAGVILWMFTLVVVFLADHEKPTGEVKKVPLAPLLLAIFPAVCQAAVIVEIDQTALPLASLCLCLAFNKLRTNATPLVFCLAVLALAAALWCRLTTPLILCAPLLLLTPQWGARGTKALYPALHQDSGAPGPAPYPAFHQDGGAQAPRPLPSVWQSHRATLRTLTAMLAGALLFLLTWWLYCRATGVSFDGPFGYLVASFTETTVGKRAGGLSFYAQNLIYLCLWGFNPFLILLFIADGIRRVKRWKQTRALGSTDTYWLCAATLLVGYTFVGGALFGFPKYQIPALPLMALAISDGINLKQTDKTPDDTAFNWIGGITAVAFFFTPDLLYIIRYSMRMAKATGVPVVWGLNFPLYTAPLLFMAVVAGLFLLIFLFKLKYKCPYAILFLACALSCNGIWNVCQMMGFYSRGYIYGDKGECMKLAFLIRYNHLFNPPFCVPVEVVQCLGLYDTDGMRPQDAPDAETLAALIQRTSPSVVALSPLIQPVDQYREMMASPILQQALEGYDRHTLRHLTYWIKKGEGHVFSAQNAENPAPPHQLDKTR